MPRDFNKTDEFVIRMQSTRVLLSIIGNIGKVMMRDLIILCYRK